MLDGFWDDIVPLNFGYVMDTSVVEASEPAGWTILSGVLLSCDTTMHC